MSMNQYKTSLIKYQIEEHVRPLASYTRSCFLFSVVKVVECSRSPLEPNQDASIYFNYINVLILLTLAVSKIHPFTLLQCALSGDIGFVVVSKSLVEMMCTHSILHLMY